MTLLTMLEQWQQAGALRALDLALVKFIHSELPEVDEAVLLAVALVSERSGHSHVCLDLQRALQSPQELLALNDDAAGAEIARQLQQRLSALTLDDWGQQLSRCPAVASGSDVDIRRSSAPFVLGGSADRPLLYLRRYWLCEQQIRDGIAARLAQTAPLPNAATQRLLTALFAADRVSEAPNWQRLACALVARSGFGIVTGGPGTGKTTTVMRLLALLQGLRLEQGLRPLVIRLAAPTGKAAARLNESIAGSLARLSLPASEHYTEATLRDSIPTEVSTLHRLLGSRPDSRKFRHHSGHPLGADLVVVDEASMVDVEMMAALLEALRPEARLILLGDKDQLASVEAGYVLGDLCAGAAEGHYTPETCDWLEQVSGERVPDAFVDPAGGSRHQALAMLRYSHRFQQGGVIHALATLVNEGRYQGEVVAERLGPLQAIFARGQQEGGVLRLLRQPQHGYQAFTTEVGSLIVDGYRAYLQQVAAKPEALSREAFDAWGKRVLEAHASFQLLAAVRRGDWGVEGLNLRIQQALSAAGLLTDVEHQWYLGRPVLVTQNDYGLGLMNGDIGICLSYPQLQTDPAASQDSSLALRVLFPDGKGGVRWVLPSRLQAVETVFAMTVHKSQGSEFAHTALLLPDHDSPVLTRELIYTGITRASQRFTLIYGSEQVLEQGMQRRVERASGLLMVE